MTRPSEKKPKAPKAEKCRVCKTPFIPLRPLQICCSPACAMKYMEAGKQRQIRNREREQRRIDKARREKLKTVSDWTKDAQTAVNRYIRLRDRGQSCISCGKAWKENFQAGHYFPKGRAAALRFDEDNIHGQCPQCNLYESGNITPYRLNLAAKIGENRLQVLEAKAHDVKRWQIEELKALIADYKTKAKELGKCKL